MILAVLLLLGGVFYKLYQSSSPPSEQQLPFTPVLADLTQLATLAQILAGLGVVTALLAFLKRAAERRRWEDFRRQAVQWIEDLRGNEYRHPQELDELEWVSKCERMLAEAGFSPLEVHQLLSTAVVVAKGIAADKFFM